MIKINGNYCSKRTRVGIVGINMADNTLGYFVSPLVWVEILEWLIQNKEIFVYGTWLLYIIMLFVKLFAYQGL